jgi:hypothetical protein
MSNYFQAIAVMKFYQKNHRQVRLYQLKILFGVEQSAVYIYLKVK